MKKLLALLLLLPLSAGAQTSAEPALAYVSALQPPAWIVVKEQRAALGSSAPIPVGATLITGAGARLHVALADGSLLKIGENTTLTLSALQLRAAKPNDVLAANLKLAGGSLRQTSDKPQRSIRNELTLQVGAAFSVQTAAADLFADVTAEAQRVALLAGDLTVTPAQSAPLKMTQARTAYVAYRKSKTAADGVVALAPTALPLSTVEFDNAHPALQSNGPYRIVLALYAEQEKAEERVRRYTELGYAVELQKPTTAHPTYRVVLEGLSNAADARNFAELLKLRLKLVNPQIESLMP